MRPAFSCRDDRSVLCQQGGEGGWHAGAVNIKFSEAVFYHETDANFVEQGDKPIMAQVVAVIDVADSWSNVGGENELLWFG